MTRAVVAAFLLTVAICLPAASEGQQYWGGNGWRQYWQPSRNPNCERAYPAKETNGYVHVCRYVCAGLPVRYNFEEDGTPCYVDRWQPGTCYAGRCRRALWAPAPVTASRVASTTAPATTSQAQPSGSEAQTVDRQGCPRAYPATAVRRSCRYLCQGWPLRHQNEADGTPCQLSSWREGFCYLGHCQKNFPVPKPVQNEDNNVEVNQGSAARSLGCRNYRGRETVDGAVRSCTFVCKRRKNAFLAVEDNGTPCWGFQGQRGFCDQGVCKAVEVQASTTAAVPAQTEASATESLATQPGSSAAPLDKDATTAAETTTATGAAGTDPATVTVTATEAEVTASPTPRSPWVPGFVGVKCDRAFPAKTIDGQVTSCRYLCEGYPRLRIGFEADGTPCLKKKTTPGVCSSGFCKPLPPPTEEPAQQDESTTRTATTSGSFATDDFFQTTVPSTTGDNETAEGAATLPVEQSTSHEPDVSNGSPTSAAEGFQTTAAQDSSLVTDSTAAGETDLQAGTTVDITVSTESLVLPGTTEQKEELPEEQSSPTSAVEANTAKGFTDSDVVGGATTVVAAEATAEERGVTASTKEVTREETTGVNTENVVTNTPEQSTTTEKGDEEAADEKSPEGTTLPSATEHLAEVSTDAAAGKEDTASEAVTQTNDDLRESGQEKETTTTSESKVAESEVVQTRTTVLDAVTKGNVEETTQETVAQTEQAHVTGSTSVGSVQEESTFSTQALPDDSDVVTVETSASQDVDSPVTSPVSVETSSEEVVNTELPTKSDSSSSTDGSTVVENGVGVTEVVATEEAVVSAAAAQTTDAFEGHTEKLGEASTSSSNEVAVDSAAGVTVATNAETIATNEDGKSSDEQPTAEPVSEPTGTQEGTEASSGLNDVSVSTAVDQQFVATETANQKEDSQTGEVWTVISEEEHVSEVMVTAGVQSTPAPVVDVTKENEPLTVDDAVTTAAVEEAAVAVVDSTAATAAASVIAVEESTMRAGVDPDFGAETTTASTAGATVVFVEKSSQVVVSEAVTEAREEEVASTSLPGALEEDAKEEVTTALPAAVVTERSTESATSADESATVKVITTITREEIVRPVDPNVEQANLTSVDTTRSTSVETLPASEAIADTDTSLQGEAAATILDSSATGSPTEVSTEPALVAVSDGITESSAREDESATVKVITTITRTEIVRPVDTDASQDDVISVEKTRSSSVETLPVSDSNSPTTAHSVEEDAATSADESAPPTTEDTGVVSSGPHIVITDFVQKSAASSKEPVTVPTAEDQTADTP